MGLGRHDSVEKQIVYAWLSVSKFLAIKSTVKLNFE